MSRVSDYILREYALNELWKEAYGNIRGSIKLKVRIRKSDEKLLSYVRSHPGKGSAYDDLVLAFKALTNWYDIYRLYQIYTKCKDYTLKKYIKNRILDLIEKKIRNNNIEDEEITVLNSIGADDDLINVIKDFHIIKYKKLELCKFLNTQKVALETVKELIDMNEVDFALKLFSCAPPLINILDSINVVFKTLDGDIKSLDASNIGAETLTRIDKDLSEISSMYNEIINISQPYKLNEIGFINEEIIKIKAKLADLRKKLIEVRERIEEKINQINFMFLDGIISDEEYATIKEKYMEYIGIINKILDERLRVKVDKETIMKRLHVLEELYEAGALSDDEYEKRKQELLKALERLK